MTIPFRITTFITLSPHLQFNMFPVRPLPTLGLSLTLPPYNEPETGISGVTGLLQDYTVEATSITKVVSCKGNVQRN
jgi:hypothetical protein